MVFLNASFREEPDRETFVAAQEPIAPPQPPPATAPGGLSEGHSLLPLPAGAGDARGQIGV